MFLYDGIKFAYFLLFHKSGFFLVYLVSFYYLCRQEAVLNVIKGSVRNFKIVHKFTHTFRENKIYSNVFSYINKMPNRLIIKRIQYREINGNICGGFCSLRRLNRFKAPRQDLGALLFSPQVEQVQSSEAKTSGLCCSLRSLIKKPAENQRVLFFSTLEVPF